MSAVGRLWRRAPAWRVCLAIAVASTALAAMFPPALPGWARRPAGGQATAPAAAHFVAGAAPSAGGFSAVAMPAASTERSGVIAFGGRGLPLPAGRWRTLVLGRIDSPISSQVEVFARVAAGELTGLLLAAAPDPVLHAPSPLNTPQLCAEPGSIADYVAPEPFGQGPLVHECWRLATLHGFDLAERGQHDPMLGAALQRLRETGVRIPEQLALLHYLRSDESGFEWALLFLPDRHGLLAWVRQYAAVLHADYAGAGHGAPPEPG